MIARGAPGLQVAQSHVLAAKLLLGQGHNTNVGFEQNAGTGSIPMQFVEWGEWEDKDFEVKFTEDASVLGTLANSALYYMDANLQEAFANSKFYPVVEFEAELYIGD